MKGSWDIMHEMHLINFIIYIRFQPDILFITNEVKKKNVLGYTSFLPACLAWKDQAASSASLSALILKQVKYKQFKFMPCIFFRKIPPYVILTSDCHF